MEHICLYHSDKLHFVRRQQQQQQQQLSTVVRRTSPYVIVTRGTLLKSVIMRCDNYSYYDETADISDQSS